MFLDNFLHALILLDSESNLVLGILPQPSSILQLVVQLRLSVHLFNYWQLLFWNSLWHRQRNCKVCSCLSSGKFFRTLTHWSQGCKIHCCLVSLHSRGRGATLTRIYQKIIKGLPWSWNKLVNFFRNHRSKLALILNKLRETRFFLL